MHSSGGGGLVLQAHNGGTISSLTIWRCSGAGISFNGSPLQNVTFDTGTLFGNATDNISMSNTPINIRFINYTSNGDTTFSTASGISIGTSNPHTYFYGCDFSTVSGIKTAHTQDVDCSGGGFIKYFLNNCKLGASTEVSSQANLYPHAFISSQKHDQTAGLHKTWKKFGTIAIETGTVHSGTTSFSMTPNNASNKLESGSFFIPVANAATLTPSVYVFENASYVSARARLILKRNDAIGITADTVIDTATSASDGAWEQLTGTTAAATDNGVMEFVVDCDGTAGILFVDSFTVT
jgi:hypothetical protein